MWQPFCLKMIWQMSIFTVNETIKIFHWCSSQKAYSKVVTNFLNRWLNIKVSVHSVLKMGTSKSIGLLSDNQGALSRMYSTNNSTLLQVSWKYMQHCHGYQNNNTYWSRIFTCVLLFSQWMPFVFPYNICVSCVSAFSISWQCWSACCRFAYNQN